MTMDKVFGAWPSFLWWAFPFLSAFVGISAILAGREFDGLKAAGFIIAGIVFILGAMDAKADRAKLIVTEKWAKLIADMVADERSVAINVNHTWESMRPYLDERLTELVAQAIEARRAETQGGSVHESAVRQDAPEGGQHDTI